MDDDYPRCTLLPPPAVSTCYCTNRPGCPYDGGDDCPYCGESDCRGGCDNETDDDAGHGDDWPSIETVTVARGLL